MKAYRISYAPPQEFDGKPVIVSLPSSKSLSNRAIILQTLAKGDVSLISQLSDARDTQTLLRCLIPMRHSEEWYVGDAGTALRFLTALAPVIGFKGWITGTARLQQRPIKSLLIALEQLGVIFEYQKEQYQIPFRVATVCWTGQEVLEVNASESSQFISALMMIAPYCGANKLTIQAIQNTPTSWSYVEMTAAMMRHWGNEVQINSDKKITIPSINYKPAEYEIALDWSSATYFFLIGYLTGRPFVLGKSLVQSRQPDSALLEFIPKSAYQSIETHDGWQISFKPGARIRLPNNFDFSHCPDMALTCLVWYAISGYTGTLHLTGLHTLNLKESKRLSLLQANLSKLGYHLEVNQQIVCGIHNSTPQDPLPILDMGDDHRMIMALAPLAVLHPIVVNDIKPVIKSFPSFTKEFSAFGFNIEEKILSY